MKNLSLFRIVTVSGLLLFGLTSCAVKTTTTEEPKTEEVVSVKEQVEEQAPKGYEIIGEYEPVTIVAAGTTFPARIDTGATTSSIDAQDIVRFERDGKSWVKFTMKNRQTGEVKKIESKIVRIAEIKRHGAKPQERPVVKLEAKLGSKKMSSEFSITDRSSFEFPVLVGRNILAQKYLVDVSKSNTTSLMKEEQ